MKIQIKQLTIISAVLLSLSFIQAQQNLVENPGFENTQQNNPDCGRGFNKFSDQEDYYARTPPWTCPLKLNCCNKIGSSDILCDDGNFGHHYNFNNIEEYTTIHLGPLTAGKQYYIEYYIKVSEYKPDCGILFSVNRPRQGGVRKSLDIDKTPHLAAPPNIATNVWAKVSGYFTADDNYGSMTLGVFNTKDKSESEMTAVSFDDFQIYEVGPNECPPLNYIQNWKFENVGEITFRSSQQTIAGHHMNNLAPYGDVIVNPTGIVTFKSEQEVMIVDEFAAEYGSEFKAVILPCGSDCWAPVASAGTDISSCNNVAGTFTLGTTAVGGQTYTWTAVTSTIANAEQYLSATNIANPVFTTPAGAGLIIYNITATNACGQSATDQIIISFDDNATSATAPNIVLSNIQNTGYYFSTDINGYNASTAAIYVQIIDANGNEVFIEAIENPYAQFGGAAFTYTLEDYIENCGTYTVNVYTDNYCNHPPVTPVSFSWTPNTTPVIVSAPNVFSPNCDGINDRLTYTVLGADKYSVYVYTGPGGSKVFEVKDQIFSPEDLDVWDGHCNQVCGVGLSSCGSINDIVGDGTYYIVTEFTNTCSGGITVSEAHYLNLFGPGARINMHQATEEEQTAEEKNLYADFTIFPNPSHDAFTIASANLKQGGTVRIINMLGQEVLKEQINAGAESAVIKWNAVQNGVYVLEFNNAQNKVLKRLIKN